MSTRKWMAVAVALAAAPALAQGTSKERSAAPKMQMTEASFDDKASEKVRATLEQRTREYESAWNAHDAQALGRFYLPDSTYLSLDGRTATGPEQIQELIRTEHEGPMRDSSVKLQLGSVRELASNLALLDVKQTVTGVKQEPGQPPIPTEIWATVVAKKQGNQWSILSLRAFPAPGATTGVGGAGAVEPVEPVEPTAPPSETMEPPEPVPAPE